MSSFHTLGVSSALVSGFCKNYYLDFRILYSFHFSGIETVCHVITHKKINQILLSVVFLFCLQLGAEGIYSDSRNLFHPYPKISETYII